MNHNHTTTDVILIGAAIVSATLATLLNKFKLRSGMCTHSVREARLRQAGELQ